MLTDIQVFKSLDILGSRSCCSRTHDGFVAFKRPLTLSVSPTPPLLRHSPQPSVSRQPRLSTHRIQRTLQSRRGSWTPPFSRMRLILKVLSCSTPSCWPSSSRRHKVHSAYSATLQCQTSPLTCRMRRTLIPQRGKGSCPIELELSGCVISSRIRLALHKDSAHCVAEYFELRPSRLDALAPLLRFEYRSNRRFRTSTR